MGLGRVVTAMFDWKALGLSAPLSTSADNTGGYRRACPQRPSPLFVEPTRRARLTRASTGGGRPRGAACAGLVVNGYLQGHVDDDEVGFVLRLIGPPRSANPISG
jgi:hypothetical protein